MAQIIQFPGRKEGEPSPAAQPSEEPEESVRLTKGFVFPPIQEIYDEDKVIFGKSPVSQIRKRLEERGRERALLILDGYLVLARLEYIQEVVEPEDRVEALIEFAKHTYSFGLQRNSDELKGIALKSLEGLVTPHDLKSIIENVTLRHKIYSGR